MSYKSLLPLSFQRDHTWCTNNVDERLTNYNIFFYIIFLFSFWIIFQRYFWPKILAETKTLISMQTSIKT